MRNGKRMTGRQKKEKFMSFGVVSDRTQTEIRHPWIPRDQLLNILVPGNILNQESEYLKYLYSLLT